MRGLAAALLLLLAATLPARAEIEIQTVTSPGGITAWLYEVHDIPILNIEASFRGGAVLDPVGQEGATDLMASLLGSGAGGLDASAFAEARETLAARLSFGAGRDEVSVSAAMLTENRAASLDLLRQALIAPRFDQDAFARVRGQRASGLRSDETDPDRLASRAFGEKVFAGHPYARPVEGTPDSVAALDVAAIRAAHAAALTRDRLLVSVAGDITADELGPILDEVFGDLPATGPPLPPVATVDADGSVSVIDLDIPQSLVVFGHGGFSRDDPDYMPAMVLDHILGGGGFGSRLTDEVRERRGLTYGIYTYLAPNDLGALYMGRFASANARVAEAIAIVRDEWQRAAAEGVTAEELHAAQRYLTGAYPLRYDGNGRIADQLLSLQISGLSPDYVTKRNALIEAVTLDDIRRVARRLLQPEALTWVVVGRPEGVEATN